MSITQQYRATIQKLKKRIHTLERQQEQGRKKLQCAMTEARKLAKSYQSKLNAKVRDIQGKGAFDQASTYARAALDMERKMLKEVEKKAKALAAAVMEIDKKHITQLVHNFMSKFSKKGNGAAKTVGKKAARKPAKKRKK